MRAPTRQKVRGAMWAMLALSGCTAVLGIQPAELSDGGTTGSVGTAGGSSSGKQCNIPPTGCSACLMASCTTAATDCLGNSECRRSLDAYATCLPADCKDSMNHCAETYLVTAASQTYHYAEQLAGCMFDHCSALCTVGPLVSKCELYCACMQSFCSQDFASTLGGTTAQCLTNCGKLTEGDANCRWSHCEYARLSAVTHCPHAIAYPIDVCNAVEPAQRHVCAAGRESGYPCDPGQDSECCSSHCIGSVCQ
jgi:hypothetical protein